jgi:type III pantothenate kinase
LNLVVDFGNTRIKAAQFEGNKILQQKFYNNIGELVDDRLFYSGCTNAIISSVTQEHPLLVNILGNKDKVLLFQSTTPIPIKNLYQSASTLGSDRLAASIGSFMLYPYQAVLTIDAGTCIKYNFVNEKAEYLGGAISPGIPMRLKAMHHFTSRLPDIKPDYNYEKLTGTNTSESLLSGALIGAAAEVDACITRYRELHEKLIVVITGGDAPYLCKQVKNPIFANPDIVLSGLNSILNYNLEK